MSSTAFIHLMGAVICFLMLPFLFRRRSVFSEWGAGNSLTLLLTASFGAHLVSVIEKTLFPGYANLDQIDDLLRMLLPILWIFLIYTLAQGSLLQRLHQQQQKLESIIDATTEGVWDWNFENNTIMWSEKLHHMLGYPTNSAPLTRNESLEIIHPEDVALRESKLNEHLKTNNPYYAEFRVRHQKGHYIWVSDTGKAIRNKEGVIKRMIGTRADITNRKISEEARSQLVAILEATPDFVGTATKEGRIVYINKAGCKMLKIPQGINITETQIPDYYPSSVTDTLLKEVLPILNKEGNHVWETQMQFKNGPTIPVSQVAIAHQSDKGEILFYSVIARNISKQQKIEERLRHATKMEAVGQLAGGVAHDFNNLLCPILLYADMLKTDLAQNSEQEEYVESISYAAQRAKDLVGQLLAFGRKQVLRCKVLSLNEIISSNSKILRRMIREDIDIKISLNATPDFINADITQIQQILINLAVNAQDAMEDGGTLSFQTNNFSINEKDNQYDSHSTNPIETIAPGKYVSLTISDTGQGIPSSIVSHIFEPFFTTKESGKGTGLGLATVHGIIKQHNGYIKIKSAENEGTCFTILFPSEKNSPQPDHTKDSLTLSETLSFGNYQLLVVEDEEDVRNLVERILNRNGFKVLSAKNALDALRLFEENHQQIDLLVTDIVMPGKNGPELYREMLKTNPNLHVVYVSGYPGHVLNEIGVDQQKITLIEKPFTQEKLISTIKNQLAVNNKKLTSSSSSL